MASASPITTHVLDTARGMPAKGVPICLEIQEKDKTWKKIGEGTTNADGRLTTLLENRSLFVPGLYRITFDLSTYFPEGFYPYTSIVFAIRNPQEHYHIPLLVSPFGYTTYRGS
jgi:5-hydroxyisourate hydrolase